MSDVPVAAAKTDATVLVSHSGVALTRATTFRFTLDVNAEQHQLLLGHAGAFRKAYNHHLGRIRVNLDQRAAERSYGVADADLTPALSWSKVSFINEMNAWKDGRSLDATVAFDDKGNEVRGLPWRNEVSADVFETASVNAAQALKNWSDSRRGARAGKPGVPSVQVPTPDHADIPAARQVHRRRRAAGAPHRAQVDAFPEAR
jgi:putative transposase